MAKTEKERTRAELRAAEDAQERVDKAAWVNGQLAERLPQEGDEQPGVAPAPDARTAYEAPKAKATPKAADKP